MREEKYSHDARHHYGVVGRSWCHRPRSCLLSIYSSNVPLDWFSFKPNLIGHQGTTDLAGLANFRICNNVYHAFLPYRSLFQCDSTALWHTMIPYEPRIISFHGHYGLRGDGLYDKVVVAERTILISIF